jgi:hypothetical protein
VGGGELEERLLDRASALKSTLVSLKLPGWSPDPFILSINSNDV